MHPGMSVVHVCWTRPSSAICLDRHIKVNVLCAVEICASSKLLGIRNQTVAVFKVTGVVNNAVWCQKQILVYSSSASTCVCSVITSLSLLRERSRLLPPPPTTPDRIMIPCIPVCVYLCVYCLHVGACTCINLQCFKDVWSWVCFKWLQVCACLHVFCRVSRVCIQT